jgi:hypothetical protein
MDPSMTPINGISLERYAELGAEVTDVVNDPEASARIVEKLGVSRADWEAASKGWTARMQDPANMGRIATAYMPLYQAALARKKGTVDCSFEDFVALSGARKALGAQRFAAQYNLDDATWYQISGAWVQRVPTNPAYQMYGIQVEQEAARIQQGGQPKPVALTRVTGGGGGGAAAAAPVQQPAYNAQMMQNQMMAQAVQQQVAAAQAQAAAQAAAAYGNAANNMGFMSKGMLGMMGMGAIASGIGPGMQVLVQWSDGNRYPAMVREVGNGQVCVAFPDGRTLWVPQTAVSRQ